MSNLYSLPFGEQGFIEFFLNPSPENFGYTPLKEPSLYSFYKGRVLKEDTKLGGFFVDIGDTVAFLPYGQTAEKLKAGDKRLFQIIRERVENKPPRLTQKFRLNLCGCKFILNGKTKFKGENCEKYLKKVEEFISLLNSKSEKGLVFKWFFSLTKILDRCGEVKLRAESLSKDILKGAEFFGFKPKVELKTLPKLLKRVEFSKNVNFLLSKRVEFEGGYLLIRPFEGFTFVDVNGYLKPFSLNLRAAKTLPSLLGLKNIGGTLLVDFANMENPKERKIFKEHLREILKRTDCKGFGFTNLGLYEIVCPKRVPTVWERLNVYSDYCGCEIKRDELLALEILERLASFREEKPTFKLHPIRRGVENLVKKRDRWVRFEFDCSVGLNLFSI